MPKLLILTYMLVKSNSYVCPLLHCSGVREISLLSHGKFWGAMDKEGMLIYVFYVIRRHDASLQLFVFKSLVYRLKLKQTMLVYRLKLKQTMPLYDAHNLKLRSAHSNRGVTNIYYKVHTTFL
jgi:hypothetical protein